MSAQSADTNLSEAIQGAEQLDQLGPTAYEQNGPILVAEIAARAALAEAVTNRARLLHDLLRDNLGENPLFLSAELDTRYSVELVRLLTSITGGSNGEA
jgi:hypothetical protein